MAPVATTNIARFVLEKLPEGFLRGLLEEETEYRVRIFVFRTSWREWISAQW